jgi:hypothetical protein
MRAASVTERADHRIMETWYPLGFRLRRSGALRGDAADGPGDAGPGRASDAALWRRNLTDCPA